MAGIPYWRLSAFYFFYFSTLGAFLPYWSLYLKGRGFGFEEIGQLVAILVGTKVVAPTLWGWIADQTGRRMGVIRWTSFGAVCAFAALFGRGGFGFVALVTLLFSFFWNAALPQFESVTFCFLGSDAHRYSLVRLWGSIGFIVAVVALGRYLDVYSADGIPTIVVGLLGTIWILSLCIREAPAPPVHVDGRSLRGILRRPAVMALFVVFMLVQLAHGPYYVFFSIYLQEYGYSGSATGLLWALGVVAEVLLFLVMHRLLKILSLRTIVLTSVFLGTVRWLLIGWGVQHHWLLIVAQLLHAATFGSAHVAAIHLVQQYFAGPHQGVGQALYSSTTFGLGGMLGSLYTGAFWQPFGPRFVYGGAAMVSLLAFLIAWWWVREKPAPEPVYAEMVVEEEL